MRPSNQRPTTEQDAGPPAYDYPGLGLPLREVVNHDAELCFPIGAHPNNRGSECDFMFVRELAMMDVMDKLTDKADWHEKVFDDEIVEKWRTEALAIPNEQLYDLATTTSIDLDVEGFLSEWSFDYVRRRRPSWTTETDTTSALKNFVAKLNISRGQE